MNFETRSNYNVLSSERNKIIIIRNKNNFNFFMFNFRYEGFLRPPYSGVFRLMIKCDDGGEFYLTNSSNGRSKTNMVYFLIHFFDFQMVFFYHVF